MSMISAQIDRLRERAKELRNLAPDPDVPYLVPSTKETMALAMRSAASEMEDAADTIWQLRDDLQQANGLMNEVEHDESRAWDRVRKAEAENAKLRELVKQMYPKAKAYLQLCVLLGSNDALSYDWELQMRELGLVDE